MRWTVLFFLLFSFNQFANAENNPFARKTSLNISDDAKWRIAGGGATKTASDNKGLFYHLLYDEKQLRLTISADKLADQPKKFTQFEVIDVLVDNKRLPLFNWCLNNQSEHGRYLQQGLSVKNDVCVIEGNRGQVTLWLDAATVASLKKAENLVFVIKPYRVSLSLNYELSDFSAMQTALADKSASLAVAVNQQSSKQEVAESCWVKPPEKNQTVKAVEYTCGNTVAKKEAETVMAKQLAAAQALALEQKKKAEKIARQKQLAKERKLKELEAARVLLAEQQALDNERLLEEEKVAENAAKQSALGVEITGTMVGMCQKYWAKGEHRCYCQKFIEYAPVSIQASLSCQ